MTEILNSNALNTLPNDGILFECYSVYVRLMSGLKKLFQRPVAKHLLVCGVTRGVGRGGDSASG